MQLCNYVKPSLQKERKRVAPLYKFAHKQFLYLVDTIIPNCALVQKFWRCKAWDRPRDVFAKGVTQYMFICKHTLNTTVYFLIHVHFFGIFLLDYYPICTTVLVGDITE